MAKNATSVLVIGLDGASFALIRPWMEEGKLPTFSMLSKNGVSGTLTSVFPPASPVAWTSFSTGKNPGKHGVMDFEMRQNADYTRTVVTGNHIDGKTLWVLLSESGKRVGVAYVPFGTYPLEEVNGFMIPGVFSPQNAPTYPSSLKEELINEIDDFEMTMKPYPYVPGMEEDYLRKITKATEKVAEVTLYLIEKYPWDLFMTTFFYGDSIQHYFWKYVDSQHPAYNSEEGRKYENSILEYYQKVDDIIKVILSKIGKHTVVILMSDHGVGAVFRYVYINHWLRKIGLLKLKRESRNRSLRRYLSRQLTRQGIFDVVEKTKLSRILLKIVPSVFLTKEYESLLLGSRLTLSDVDWTQTKAYSAGWLGQIFINLKGRESSGIVKPGKEYNELREHLISKLYELKDPRIDERIVDKVFKREEIYWGPLISQAADLFFVMKNMKYVTYRHGFEFGPDLNSLTEPAIGQSATHRMDGILIISGPYIKRGILEDANIMDIAPTILHIMHVSIPSDMDGRVLKEIFKPRSDFARRDIKYTEPSVQRPKRKVFTKEEEKELEERLKALGYID